MATRNPNRPDPIHFAFYVFAKLLSPVPALRWIGRHLRGEATLTDVDFELSRGGPGLDGLTIAFVSDLHLGNFMERAEVESLFARIAARRPDILALGGDLVEHRPDELALLHEALGPRPPLGIFAIPGNHEHRSPSLRPWVRALEPLGVQVLLNRGVAIVKGGDRLWLAGVDDLSRGAPDLDRALEGREEGDPVVLLAHEPDFFREAVRAGVDVTLSGHTHGGQIAIRGWTPVRHTKYGYWRGRFEEGGSSLYVGRGAGTTALPIRIGAPAEVPIVRLLTRTDS
ncbi:MAG: metallophosphoesterase [Planctomycetota bacterium]